MGRVVKTAFRAEKLVRFVLSMTVASGLFALVNFAVAVQPAGASTPMCYAVESINQTVPNDTGTGGYIDIGGAALLSAVFNSDNNAGGVPAYSTAVSTETISGQNYDYVNWCNTTGTSQTYIGWIVEVYTC
jgi:hypothetical protein